MKPNRVDVAAIALLVVTLGAAYLGVLRPAGHAIKRLQGQTNTLRATARVVPILEREVRNVRLSLGPEREEQQMVIDRLGQRQDIEKFVQDVAASAQAEQVQLQLIRPGTIKRQAFASVAPVVVNAAGGFDRIFRFLQRVEDLPWVACLDDWTVENDLAMKRGTATTCRVELNLALYLETPAP